jgi:hypothetical protein
MSTERDTIRIVRSWLEEGVTALPDRVLDAVLDQVPATHQRRAWWPAWRFPHMNNYARFALGAAAVVIAALLAINVLPRSGGVGGQPTAAPESSPVPFSSTPISGALDPGSIVLDGDFPLAIAFDVPAGWTRDGSTEGADLVSIYKIRGDSYPAWSSWAIIANVYGDPCHALSGPIDPPIGPTVDDLVTALTSMAGFESTNPTDVTIDGHAGKRFELSNTIDPAADGCDDNTWLSLWEPASGGDTAKVPGALTMQFWVVDVDGTRLVMFTEDYGATATESAESIDILESTRFP